MLVKLFPSEMESYVFNLGTSEGLFSHHSGDEGFAVKVNIPTAVAMRAEGSALFWHECNKYRVPHREGFLD